jgi:putative transcriptional regulator
MRRIAQLAIFLLACAGSLAAQSKRPEDLALGKILVTPRDAPDPAFAEAVILLARYGDTGVVGLMLNRRSTMPVSRILRDVPGAPAHSDPVFVGGPVELDTVLALARAPRAPEGAANVFGSIHLIASRAALEKALGATTGENELRIYLGYCGWTRPQLEYEVSRGAWYIFNRSEDLTFDPSPGTLWTRMIGKAEEQIVRSDNKDKPRDEIARTFLGPHSGAGSLRANAAR